MANEGEAKKELGEVVEALEEAVGVLEEVAEGDKLSFWRWLIRLVVEKLLAPVLVPCLTAVLTTIGGWYVYGQHQVKDQATEAAVEAAVEVEKRGSADALVNEVLTMPEVHGAGSVAPVVSAKPVKLNSLEIDAAMRLLRDKWTATHVEQPQIQVHDSGDDTDSAILKMDHAIQAQRIAFPEDYIRAKLEREEFEPQIQEQLQEQNER